MSKTLEEFVHWARRCVVWDWCECAKPTPVTIEFQGGRVVRACRNCGKNL